MARTNPFRIVVASDGSTSAKAAIRTALRFPWPSPSIAAGVTARFVRPDYRSSVVLAALDRTTDVVAEETHRLLATRWHDADARVVVGAPADAIVGEARRTRADAIVMGWRGHGAVRRLVSGSVSRAVVRDAPCPVLVVRTGIRKVSTIVIGIDGSSRSLAACDLVARCVADGRRIVLVTAVDTMHVPSLIHLTSSMRATVAGEVRRINKKRMRDAEQTLRQMKQKLTSRGWKVTTAVSEEAPLEELLSQVTKSRADLLVVGARGATGLDRLILGSVAEGALNRSPVPVLVVR